jgi:peptidoglycan hydrolase-like protein with peptidoglycan-binding domain
LLKLKQWGIFWIAAASLLFTCGLSAAQTNTSKTNTRKAVHKKSRKHRVRGQAKIDSERIHKIQEALVRENFLTGEPSGKWDDSTQAALRKYQASNGWQSKVVPDSRALIKLGLGPDHDHLLNPESAMTSMPAHTSSVPAATSTPASDPAKKSQ